MANVYFDLTEEFNAEGLVAVLSSGQAVVHYRLALMSKDGDWIVREDEAACARIRAVLAVHGARYRAGAPLDPRWLAGGWSSHFEHFDARGLRIRCDFVSRPPRVPLVAVRALFTRPLAENGRNVLDVPLLIAAKRTQRAKDYPIIGALARLLPPDEELRFTTDPDRVLELSEEHGAGIERLAVQLARAGRGRDAVVVALAREADRLQLEDKARLAAYQEASENYLRELLRLGLTNVELERAQPDMVALAEGLLPTQVG